MAGKNLPGTYESETPGATKRAQELLDAYRKSKKEGTYELTTKESQEIREAIKTYVSSLLNKEKEFKKLKKDVEAEAAKTK